MANNKLLASDNFASGSLAAGWSAALGNTLSQIVNVPPQCAEPAAVNAGSAQAWTGLTWPSDQISEITINSMNQDTGTEAVLFTRLSDLSATPNCYYLTYGLGAAGAQNIKLYRMDAGVTAQLGSTVGSLTSAAGDVLSLSSIGSCHSVYLNQKRIVYWYDATYTAGSPGFQQYTAAGTVSRMQISAWRGYSAVQQDGVWTKKGVVFPANSTDLPYGCANASNIIQGPAQLLSGTVYKIWFSSWSANAIGYAESTDGVNWTRNGTAVLSGVIDPGVIQNGSTLYMYAFSNVGGTGHGPCNVYTSPATDGRTWTLAASNIAGASQFFFQPFAIIAGTWYAIASGNLWTSADGLAWANQGLVIPTAGNGGMCGGMFKVSGVWYLYTQAFSAGATGAAEGTETNRFRCTDNVGFTTWVLDCHSMHISQPYEGVNTFNGQCVPGPIFQVGSQVYSLFTQCPGDLTTPAIYQICLSTVPTTLANLISFKEDARSQVATDPFTGGPGGLGPNWTAGLNALQVVAGPFVEATTTNTACFENYTGASLGNNQYSEVTIHNMANTSALEPYVRALPVPANFTYYGALITGNTGSTATVQVRSRLGGAGTNIGPAASINLAVGDRIGIQVYNGSDGFPVLDVFQNDYSILQVQDYNNALPSGGAPGFYIDALVALTDVQVSKWTGGNANVMPNYPVIGGGGSASIGPDIIGVSYDSVHIGRRRIP